MATNPFSSHLTPNLLTTIFNPLLRIQNNQRIGQKKTLKVGRTQANVNVANDGFFISNLTATILLLLWDLGDFADACFSLVVVFVGDS